MHCLAFCRKVKTNYGIHQIIANRYFSASSAEYQTLKLMQMSISQINVVCQSLLDNLQLDTLIPAPPARKPPLYSAKGVKNTRRHMEDRHIIIDDFNSIFGLKASGLAVLSRLVARLALANVVTLLLLLFFPTQDTDPTSYYAVFDGHGGIDAAAYSVSHLHCELAASEHYPSAPAKALREAFVNTDKKFLEKSEKQVRFGVDILRLSPLLRRER